MRRLFLVSVVFVLLGLALFAAWAGMRASSGYVAAVHEVGGHPDVRVIETSFERGWLRSSAHTTFEVHGQLGAAFRTWMMALGAEAVRPRLGLELRHEFLHGPASLWSWVATGMVGSPTVIEVRTRVELDKESNLDMKRHVAPIPPALLVTQVRPTGSETELLLSAGEGYAHERVRKASWQDLTGRIEPRGSRISAYGGLHGFHGIGRDLEIEAEGIRWEVDSMRGSSEPARVVVRVASLALRHEVEGTDWITVHDLELGQAEEGPHGPDASRAYLRFVRAELGGEVFGPGRFEIVAPRQRGELAEGPEPDRAVRRVVRALGLLPGFVLRAPHAELTKFFVNTPYGPVRGGGELQLAALPEGLRSARLDLQAPPEALTKLREAWLPGAPEEDAWYREWESLGLLARRPQGYRMRVRVEDGTLTVNQVAAEDVFTLTDEEEEETAAKEAPEEPAEASEGEAAEASGGEAAEEVAGASEGETGDAAEDEAVADTAEDEAVAGAAEPEASIEPAPAPAAPAP